MSDNRNNDRLLRPMNNDTDPWRRFAYVFAVDQECLMGGS